MRTCSCSTSPAGSSPSPPRRSGWGRLDLGDLNWEHRPYQPARAYNDSKLANLLFTAELRRRLDAAGSGVLANAAHPGLVATNIYHHASHRPSDLLWAVAEFGRRYAALRDAHSRKPSLITRLDRAGVIAV